MISCYSLLLSLMLISQYGRLKTEDDFKHAIPYYNYYLQEFNSVFDASL